MVEKCYQYCINWFKKTDKKRCKKDIIFKSDRFSVTQFLL